MKDDQDRPITPEDIVRGSDQGYMVVTPAMKEHMAELLRTGGDVDAYLKVMIELKEAGTPPADKPH